MITSDRSNAVALGFDSYTSPGPSIKWYNPLTNGYTGPAGTATALYNPKGYFVFVRGDRSVTVYNQPANPTILRSKGRLFDENYVPPPTILGTEEVASVGNPYASPIDFRLVSKTGLTDVYQVWDPRLGGAYNYGAFQTFTKNTIRVTIRLHRGEEAMALREAGIILYKAGRHSLYRLSLEPADL